MPKMITWSTPKYSGSKVADQTDSLFFAADVIRYLKFTSPLSIKFCLREGLRYVVANQKIVLTPGSYLLVNDGAEMECLPNNPGVEALIVFFTNELVHDVYRNLHTAEKNLLDTPDPASTPVHFFQHLNRHPNPLTRQLRQFATQMAACATSEHSLAPDPFYRLTEKLFALETERSRQIDRVNARTPATRAELYNRVWQAREFMHDHWQSDLNLHDVARHACLSPYHFHRSFREAFGQSPMKWFGRLKMQKARALLDTGHSSVTQVAHTCGFADVFSFSKAFKREWGVPPSKICSRPDLLPGC